MQTDFNLRARSYWQRLGWGLFVGLLSALGAFIFLGLMNLGQSLILPEMTDWTLFSGPWVMVPIMTVAGLVVGLIHHFTSAAQLDVFGALKEGEMDPKPVPASLLMYMVVAPGSIIGFDWILLGLGIFADMATYFGSYRERERVPYGETIP